MTLTGHNTTTWITPPWVRGLPGIDCPNGCTQRIRDAREDDTVPWCGECDPPDFAVVCGPPRTDLNTHLSRNDWVRRGEVADFIPVYIRHGDEYLHIDEAQRRGILIPPVEIDKPMGWRNFVTTHRG